MAEVEHRQVPRDVCAPPGRRDELRVVEVEECVLRIRGEGIRPYVPGAETVEVRVVDRVEMAPSGQRREEPERRDDARIRRNRTDELASHAVERIGPERWEPVCRRRRDAPWPPERLRAGGTADDDGGDRGSRPARAREDAEKPLDPDDRGDEH